MLVISSDTFSGTCMLAGLAQLPGLNAQACENPATYTGDAPDIVMLMDLAGSVDTLWLPRWLAQISSLWPAAAMLVVTNDVTRDVPLCMQFRVRACFSPLATLELLAAAILLITGNMFVYEGEPALFNLPPGGAPPPVAHVADTLFGKGPAGGNGAVRN